MRGRVQDGRVELDGELPEGSDVVVMVTTADEPFDLAESEIAELEARMAGPDRDELMPAVDLLAKLHSTR